VTVYCQQNVSEHKKNVLISKGVKVVLHGVDCVEAENEGRASAKVRVDINILLLCYLFFFW
jgi:D-serine dehydratase